jgi:hypothetical protein
VSLKACGRSAGRGLLPPGTLVSPCPPDAWQIENKQYVVKIEELNDELISLKSTTGKTIKARAYKQPGPCTPKRRGTSTMPIFLERSIFQKYQI